jgi:hypothetical protein
MSQQEQKLNSVSSSDAQASGLAMPVEPTATTPQQEAKKRRREIVLIVFLAGLLLFLTLFEFRLAGISEQLPFGH